MPPFTYQPFTNPYAASIGELLTHQNDAAARAAEMRGQVVGRAVEQIGQLPQQIQAQQDADMVRQSKRLELDAAAQDRNFALQKRVVSFVGNAARSAKSADEFGARLDDLTRLGAVPPDVATHIKTTAAQAGPDGWAGLQKQYVDFAAQFAAPVTLGDKAKIVNPVSGETIAENAGAPTETELATRAAGGDAAAAAALDRLKPKPQPTQAALAADASNPNSPTRAQSQAALDALQQPATAGREETERHNKEMERIAGLTAGRAEATAAETARHNKAMEAHAAAQDADAPELSEAGLNAAAEMYATTGQLPAMGMGGKAATVRAAIINRAAERHPELNIAANKADYGAESDTLKQLQKQRAAIGAFEQTAQKNIDIFLQQAQKVVDTGSPLLNTPVRMISGKVLGAPDQAAYDAARQVAVNEIAKITSNPTLAGQLSDSARHEVEAFNPQSATLKQTVAVMNLLKRDMQNRTKSLDDAIAQQRGNLRGGAPSASGRIRAKDPQGNIHEAPAGTPLPEGWVSMP